MVNMREGALGRPSAWWYALPSALLVVVLCFGGFALSVTTVSGERAATPIAGPGDSVHFVMQPGVTYTVYQQADRVQAGSDCTLGPDGNEAEGLSAGTGGAWGNLFVRRPKRVIEGGARYEFGIQLSNVHRRGIEVSCRGGPILVESRADIVWPVVVAGALLVATTAVALGAIAWLRRRRLVQQP